MRNLYHVALVLLGLLSLGRSAPATGCDSLTQPLEIKRDQLLGKWTQLAESTNILGSRLITKMFVDSAWARFTAASEDDGLNAYYSYKMLGRCFSLSTSYTVVNNTVSLERPYVSSGVLLSTSCPDCLVYYGNVTLGTSTFSGLQLLSRRTQVTPAELEEFKKQLQCLNLPSPAMLDSKKGFCPATTESQETETIDLTNSLDNMNAEVLSLFTKYFTSENGVQKFIQLVQDGFAALKQK